MTIKVGLKSFVENEATVLGYLLHPYDIELTEEADDSDLVICRGSPLPSSRPVIRVRSVRKGNHLELTSYDNEIVEISYDLIRACSQRFEAVMNPRVAFMHKLANHLPFQYNIVPSSIRSRILRMRNADSNLLGHLTNETARKILKEAFSVLGFHLHRKCPPSLVITHDVETEKGLRKALRLKAVDNELGVQSTWFLPSDEYPIAKHIARDLAEGSTIGSHDIKHDAKLIHISRHDELVQRLRESKVKLEDLFEKDVKCFRSPLLQFSHRIVSSLSEVGYTFDFSLPCWEPVHPLTMNGFGVESVQKFKVEGVIEVPLTLFQDHQILNVLRMNTHKAVKFWAEQAKLVRAFDGDIVLLIHPDYAFSRDLERYREVLVSLLEVQASSAS